MIMHSKGNVGAFVRYVIIGFFTTAVGLGVFHLMLVLFLAENNPFELQTANTISWICAVLFAFVTNRRIVFKSQSDMIFLQFVKFTGSRIGTLLFENLLLYIFASRMGMNTRIIKIMLIAITTMLNYLLSRQWVFTEGENRG